MATISGSKPRARVFRHLQRNAANQPVAAAATSDTDAAFPTDGDNVGPDAIGNIEPGFAQLYSYYEPGLQGGVYEINVDHKIRHPNFAASPPDPPDPSKPIDPSKPQPAPFSPDQIANPVSTQFFNVNVPRFNLPPKIIHQTYPPQGLADHNNVLPHVVFEDVHFPWENEGSVVQDEADVPTNHDKATRARNKVPWIALWTFGENEIRLSDTELKASANGGLFPAAPVIPSHSVPPTTDHEQDKVTFAVRLTMGEYLQMGGWTNYKQRDPAKATVTIPHFDNDDFEKIDRTEQVNVVFVKREVFEKHFCSYDDAGNPKPPPSDGRPTADVSRYQYLAHVKNVNQLAMAGLDLPDEGLYSVVHAHRTGPLDLTSPTPRIVHLVSIMDVETNISLPLDPSKPETKWVAMISLYSWTYLSLPPETVNFTDTMRAIGHSIKDDSECWLRVPDKVIRSTAGIPAPTATAASAGISAAMGAMPADAQKSLQYRLATRMLDGYSLQRYMLQTGEETVCLFRGPLSPTYVSPIKSRKDDGWWPLQSNFSPAYQILDPNLGIMDITYSSAWQLGRTLGIADQAFTAALIRLRGLVVKTAWRGAKKDVAGGDRVQSKAETMNTLATSMRSLASLGVSPAGQKVIPRENRINKLVNPPPKLVLERGSGPPPAAKTLMGAKTSAAFGVVLSQHVNAIASKIASASDHAGGQATSRADDGQEVYIPFSEINIPASPDWNIVQSWILDKLSLHNIPAHYLISDPSHLPLNSIRFFYIDPNWMDAFIDGALAIGNHLDQEDDIVRQAFKKQLNRYFGNKLGTGNLDYLPQVPSFGFFLRSSVVRAFPNLEVHAPWPVSEEMGGNRMETVRLDCLETDTLLCLFDRMPGSAHWNSDPGADGSRRTGITIAQPPHQQCFRLGAELQPDYVQMIYRSLYTREPDDLPQGRSRYASLLNMKWKKTGGPKLIVSVLENGVDQDEEHDPNQANPPLPVSQQQVFETATITLLDDPDPKKKVTSEANMLIFPAFAKSTVDILNNRMMFNNNAGVMTKYFDDASPSSAVTAEILGSFVSVMNIHVPQGSTTSTTGSIDDNPPPPDATTSPRQIRLPADEDPDQTKWKLVPAPDQPDRIPKPRPPPDRKPPAPAPLPRAPIIRPPKYPQGFSPDAFVFPESEKTTGIVPLQSSISPQWTSDAFVLGTNPVPATNKINPVPLFASNSPKFGLPMDLIIRLVAPTGAARQIKDQNLQIFSIDVDLPVGQNDSDLTAKYEGPGGTMLNNQKWNVHVAQAVSKVTFTLIPRSTTGLSALTRNEELSFAIWGVLPNVKEGRVLVKVTENYRTCDRKTTNGIVLKHQARSNADLRKVKAT